MPTSIRNPIDNKIGISVLFGLFGGGGEGMADFDVSGVCFDPLFLGLLVASIVFKFWTSSQSRSGSAVACGKTKEGEMIFNLY